LELLGRCRWPSIAKPGSRARGPTGGVGADMRGGTVEAEGRTRLGREIPRADAAVDGDVTARVDGKAAIRGAEHLPVALLGWLDDPVSTRRPRQGRGGRGRRRGGGRAATGVAGVAAARHVADAGASAGRRGAGVGASLHAARAGPGGVDLAAGDGAARPTRRVPRAAHDHFGALLAQRAGRDRLVRHVGRAAQVRAVGLGAGAVALLGDLRTRVGHRLRVVGVVAAGPETGLCGSGKKHHVPRRQRRQTA